MVIAGKYIAEVYTGIFRVGMNSGKRSFVTVRNLEAGFAGPLRLREWNNIGPISDGNRGIENVC